MASLTLTLFSLIPWGATHSARWKGDKEAGRSGRLLPLKSEVAAVSRGEGITAATAGVGGMRAPLASTLAVRCIAVLLQPTDGPLFR